MIASAQYLKRLLGNISRTEKKVRQLLNDLLGNLFYRLTLIFVWLISIKNNNVDLCNRSSDRVFIAKF